MWRKFLVLLKNVKPASSPLKISHNLKTPSKNQSTLQSMNFELPYWLVNVSWLTICNVKLHFHCWVDHGRDSEHALAFRLWCQSSYVSRLPDSWPIITSNHYSTFLNFKTVTGFNLNSEIEIEVLGVPLISTNFSLNFSDLRAKLIQLNMSHDGCSECLPMSSVLFWECLKMWGQVKHILL